MSTMPTVDEAGQAGVEYQCCRWCGTPAYRRLLCPSCASSDLTPAHAEGVGIVTRAPVGAGSDVLVQLREGVTVPGRIVGAPDGRVCPGVTVRLTAGPEPDSADGGLWFRLGPVE
ncbi:hypothetical protein GXW82_07565 [Streptacidiphilus sp. 4-A2]|nr:hypothetical protein [Streptacidiphilus sp. 4-A2]